MLALCAPPTTLAIELPSLASPVLDVGKGELPKKCLNFSSFPINC